MRPFTSFASLTLLGMLATAAPGQVPDAKGIIAKANQAAKAVRMVSYRAEAWGEGAFADQMPRFRATVSTKEGGFGVPPLLRLEGTMSRPGSDETQAFHVVVDGKQVLSTDEQAKVCTIGQLPEAIDLFIEPLQMVYLEEFLHATPFRDAFNADSLKYEGQKTVAGTACYVIYAVYPGGRVEARWHLGVDDYLPRRVDYILRDEQRTGTRVLELSDVDITPDFDEATFAIRVPEGYERKTYERPLQSDPRMLAVGSPAPDWTLKTPEGKSVSLSELRGKVVVLDFWATWCLPCVRAMPGVQKLHERFKGKPVAVFGVNVGERTWYANPVAFMKQRGCTYGLLLGGGNVAQAYRVVGIPTFYVIGPDGKVLHASAGYDPSAEDAFVRLIESALEKKTEKE